MITSTTNSKVKHIRRLQNDRRYRERSGQFVVEGTRWIHEAAVHLPTEAQLFHTASWASEDDNRALLARFTQPPQAVAGDVMATMSDLETAPGILAVLPMQPKPLPPSPTLLLVLDAIQIPGNLGTMLRAAGAAGADGVILAPGSVDAYNPKVLRGAMGAHLRLPIHSMVWDDIRAATAHTTICLAAAAGNRAYTDMNWRQPATLIIGSEAHGASEEARRLAQHTVYIPMFANTESLNAAMAAAVILFEAARQRRN